MKLAIMQPYIYPYIGYFHLIHSVDKFIFLEDVSYINRGWINRNRIASLDGKSDHLFTIPLDGASQNKKINEIRLHDNYHKWLDSFHKTFRNAYRNAPYFETAESLLAVLYLFKPGDLISDLAKKSIQTCYERLHCAIHGNIGSKIWETSVCYNNADLKKGNRLIDICHKENAEHYHNAIGGQALYTKEEFISQGVALSFVQSQLIPYRDPFVPGLSILDLFAYANPESLQQQLNAYNLI